MPSSLPEFTFILFGGTGDLSMRKIIPALYAAHHSELLHPSGKIIAISRHIKNLPDYLTGLTESVQPQLSQEKWDAQHWGSFLKRFIYLSLDLTCIQDYAQLYQTLHPFCGTCIFFLATSPNLFSPICQGLAHYQMNQNARIVVEKPLGYDLESSKAINDLIGQHFSESQIFRIDHYLGKEPVQNLLALRFANVLFEPLWRREWVDNVQISITEELGVENRAQFYDQTGALRDMLQNHLLQLLTIIAMEPPQTMDAQFIRHEKLRVLHALKPLNPEQIDHQVIRGQYQAGVIQQQAALAYQQEPGIHANSHTETFVALKAEIDNWRWAGVPFFLRTGKRLAERSAEIIINFKPVPHSVFGKHAFKAPMNRLVINLQPKESIRLYCLAKEPGDNLNLASVHLDLAFNQFLNFSHQMQAYQRLLLDVIHNRIGLFVHRDEQEVAWQWVAPIQAAWENAKHPPRPYASGSWGPAAASTLLAQHNTCWPEETSL